jgi:hypothetical protein
VSPLAKQYENHHEGDLANIHVPSMPSTTPPSSLPSLRRIDARAIRNASSDGVAMIRNSERMDGWSYWDGTPNRQTLGTYFTLE